MLRGKGDALHITVHDLFARQVRSAPDATAVISSAGALSYAELARRSTRIALQLRALGVGPGARVGLLAQRGPDTVAALLGILRLGAAYVPFDLSYPPDTLAGMLADSDPAAMVVQSSAVEALGGALAWDRPTLRLDGDASGIAAADESELADIGSAEDLAYVLYTSGSTGRPKGVMVPHRAIVRLVRDTDYAEFGPSETILHLAPLTFDASTFEIWGSLLNGGRLAIVESVHPSLGEIGQAISRYGVTTAWLTAGLFHLMVDHRIEDLRPLRQLLAGGDVLSPSHVDRALRELPGCRLINGYGPTENTTFTCCHTIPKDRVPGSAVPIGRPIANTEVHVLDADLAPVPDGEAGQLCVGGAGLALGYLNRPDLTDSRFVPAPFTGRPGEQMYLTGDLVRRGADGVLEFHGRIDRQVKINGKRVELDAIEEAIRQSGLFRDAVVTVSGAETPLKRIVAYVTGAAAGPDACERLREDLRRRLPDFSIPSSFMILDSFPLLPSGKVDRSALPAAAPAVAGDAAPSSSAPGRLEPELLAVWRRVLRNNAIGPNDNFFDAGGTSLQLIEVQEAIRGALGLEIPVLQLFANPTVRHVARSLGSEGEPAAVVEAARERARRQEAMLGRVRSGMLARMAAPRGESRPALDRAQWRS
jgi:amino acid adenylation domain-containing protein